jgi:hypothetical protein
MNSFKDYAGSGRSTKTTPRALLLLLCILTLAGCSSTPSRVDTGQINARGFRFVDPDNRQIPGYADYNPEDKALHAMIQEAITREFKDKGVVLVQAGADIQVAYLLIVGNNATTKTIDDYFGYSDSGPELHEKAHKAYTAKAGPNYFEAGTLVIDVIDAKTSKLLKRNHGTRPIVQNVSAEARATRIREVVGEILRDLPVAQ